MDIVRTLVLPRPADEVFAYLQDFTNTEEWDPGTVRTTRESGDGGVGTRYHNVPKFLGRETELTYVVNDAWQIDATLGYNDAEISEATVLTLVDEVLDITYEIPVEKGARLPLAPDWSGSLGIEWRRAATSSTRSPSCEGISPTWARS